MNSTITPTSGHRGARKMLLDLLMKRYGAKTSQPDVCEGRDGRGEERDCCFEENRRRIDQPWAALTTTWQKAIRIMIPMTVMIPMRTIIPKNDRLKPIADRGDGAGGAKGDPPRVVVLLYDVCTMSA